MFFLIVVFFFLILFCPQPAAAVPPPDFLLAIGSQVVQVFAFCALLLSAAAGILTQVFRSVFFRLRRRKILLIAIAAIIVIVSLSAALLYENYREQAAYQDWVIQSTDQTSGDSLDLSAADLLKNNSDKTTEVANDPKAIFIQTYYENISNGRLAEAYAVWTKSVPFETYESWYENTQSAIVDFIQAIDNDTYSMTITLTEKEAITRFAVVMTIDGNEINGWQIIESISRAISSAENNEEKIEAGNFFLENQNLPLAISNEDFSDLIDNSGLYVLDAREDEEYDIGNFPGSEHIRFADLLAGEWISLPTDQVIYVFCWSGLRGEEVAQFLRKKSVLARFVENGADGWVKSGGIWDGGIAFSSKYSEERYKKTLTLEELLTNIEGGAAVVDSRPLASYNAWHIPNSINIPIIYTPTSQMEKALSLVPSGVAVITVCDDFISCFDAKVTGIKLEAKDHEFLGRYVQPWEYRTAFPE